MYLWNDFYLKTVSYIWVSFQFIIHLIIESFTYLLACILHYLFTESISYFIIYIFLYLLSCLLISGVCVEVKPFYFYQFLLFVFIYSCTYLLSVHSDSHPHSTVAPHCELFHPKCKCKHYTYTIPVIFQCGNPQSTGPTGGKQASSVCVCGCAGSGPVPPSVPNTEPSRLLSGNRQAKSAQSDLFCCRVPLGVCFSLN